MKKLPLVLSFVIAGLVVGGPALAQRRILGTEEPAADAGPPPEEKKDDKKKDDKKKDDKKKPDEKKPDEKKTDDKKPDEKKPDDKKPDDKKVDPKKDDKKVEPPKKDEKKGDILDETDAEKKKREADDAKKKAAEKATEEAAEKERLKKEEEQKKLVEEKKAADQKRKLENRDARLATAKKIRQITRASGGIGTSFAIEPGEVKPGSVVEIRAAVAKKLDKADPRYGNFEPQKGLVVVALVTEPGSKQPVRYVMHELDTPGRYGFHFTPSKAGAHALAIEGKGRSSFDASFTVHVGVWPPPDFDDEEKNNAASTDDAARSGRKLIGGN
jgi:hypothetical protein